MNHEQRQAPEIADEVIDVYISLLQDIDARDAGLGRNVPEGVASEPVADHLQLPLRLWHSGRKPTRTVPALVAYDEHLDVNDARDLMRVMVGLDVLVTMLDEFIDSSDADSSQRLQLSINVAFASLLSFTSIPDDAPDEVDEAVRQYLVEAARIPMVERSVQRELESTTDPDRAMGLLAYSYAYRARDISVFGRLPALWADFDEHTADRIVSDLETFRAHSLLFDDLRDVHQDRSNGIRTPVLWLLDTHDDPAAVVDSIAEIFQSFEYSDSPYCESLQALERVPENLDEAIATAMNSLEESVQASKIRNPQ